MGDHAYVQEQDPFADPVDYDAVVVGGGPAGLHAALHLARAGGSVAIVDEAPELGGQYYKRRHAQLLRQFGDHRPEGTELIRAVRDAGVHCLTDTLVWGVQDDRRTLLLAPANHRQEVLAPRSLRGRATIVTTGAFELAVPFPGWTLPGVVTAGHALHLATCDLVPVGARVLVAGTGPFLLPVATALLKVGCHVVGVAEANRPYRPRLGAVGALGHPARLRELAAYLTTLARHRVPIWQGWHIDHAAGQGDLASVRLRAGRGDGVREVEVDALAVGYGFRPATELVRLLGCTMTGERDGTEPLPVRDRWGRTSAVGVYVAGEAAGVAGVHAAAARGTLVAAAAAQDLGLHPLSSRMEQDAARRVRSTEALAALTARLFPAPADRVAALPDDTLVCRCEAVTAGQVRCAAATGWNERSSTKGATRAGMGPCQGRECGFAVSVLVQHAGGRPGAPFPARQPIKPIPLSVAMGRLDQELAQ